MKTEKSRIDDLIREMQFALREQHDPQKAEEITKGICSLIDISTKRELSLLHTQDVTLTINRVQLWTKLLAKTSTLENDESWWLDDLIRFIEKYEDVIWDSIVSLFIEVRRIEKTARNMVIYFQKERKDEQKKLSGE